MEKMPIKWRKNATQKGKGAPPPPFHKKGENPVPPYEEKVAMREEKKKLPHDCFKGMGERVLSPPLCGRPSAKVIKK